MNDSSGNFDPSNFGATAYQPTGSNPAYGDPNTTILQAQIKSLQDGYANIERLLSEAKGDITAIKRDAEDKMEDLRQKVEDSKEEVKEFKVEIRNKQAEVLQVLAVFMVLFSFISANVIVFSKVANLVQAAAFMAFMALCSISILVVSFYLISLRHEPDERKIGWLGWLGIAINALLLFTACVILTIQPELNFNDTSSITDNQNVINVVINQ